MSTPTAFVFGLARRTPMAARPEPAPTSSTRPDPEVRKRSVGSDIGRLSIALRITTAAAAQTATRTAGMITHRDQDRHMATAAIPPPRISGASIAYRIDQL